MIMFCTCQHLAQDYFHGKGKRVHNYCKNDTAARCTVCKSEKQLTKQQTKDIKTGGKE